MLRVSVDVNSDAAIQVIASHSCSIHSPLLTMSLSTQVQRAALHAPISRLMLAVNALHRNRSGQLIPVRSYSLGKLLLPVASPRGRREPIAPPPPLPSAQIVRVGDDCALEYVDLAPVGALNPATKATRTFVLFHGAPGTYQDFRYLIPHLQETQPEARIVAINFPGFGGSTIDKSRYLELLDAKRAAQLTHQALCQLIDRDRERLVLTGHSFGGHGVLNVAAHNQEQDEEALHVEALVLLAAAGMRPHRVLRPRENAMLLSAMRSLPPAINSVLASVVKTFYTTLLRFPSDFPPSHYVAGVVRAGTTDFGSIRCDVAQIRNARLPSFSAWSSDDEFMEDDVPIALAEALGSSARLAFDDAGHNLQKTRAEVLASEITAWLDNQQSLCQTEALIRRHP